MTTNQIRWFYFSVFLTFSYGIKVEKIEKNKSFDSDLITLLFITKNTKVCWEKFARYFEVELKEVKLREGYYVMDPEKAVDLVDENTICVAAILGSTLNGEFEDVKVLNDLLIEKNKETGYNFFLPLSI